MFKRPAKRRPLIDPKNPQENKDQSRRSGSPLILASNLDITALEPRILLDAAIVATGAEIMADTLMAEDINAVMSQLDLSSPVETHRPSLFLSRGPTHTHLSDLDIAALVPAHTALQSTDADIDSGRQGLDTVDASDKLTHQAAQPVKQIEALKVTHLTSQESSTLDTDGDGRSNADDLDDDNDGILDVDEGVIPAGVNLLSNSSFELLNEDAALGNGFIFGGGFGELGDDVFDWDLVSGTADIYYPDGAVTLNGTPVAAFDITQVGQIPSFIGGTPGPSDGSVYAAFHSGDGNFDAPGAQADGRETIINNLQTELQPGTEYTLTFDVFQADGLVSAGRGPGGIEIYTIDTGATPDASTAYQDGTVVGGIVDNAGATGINFIGLSEDVTADGSASSGTAANGTAGWQTISITFTVDNVTDRILLTPESGLQIYYAIDNLTLSARSDISLRDIDRDGIADSLDLDSDNDGISDLVESGQNQALVDQNNDGILDDIAADSLGADQNLNGISDGLEAIHGTANGVTLVNTDGDTLTDNLDLDSDGDGIPDIIEARPTAAFMPSDGDVSDEDSDGDGVIDRFDNITGFGASFTQLANSDFMDQPDVLDLDSDNDGVSDEIESGLQVLVDTDGDGDLSDETPAGGFTLGNDGDGDGIADIVGASRLDPDGLINNPQTVLLNEVGDTSEVAFREPIIAPVNLVPAIDLDVTMQADTPGENGFTELNFAGLNGENNPTISNAGQTEAENGSGNGERALFENVGEINGTAIDIQATVISSDNRDPLFSVSGGDNANVNIGRNGNDGSGNNTATIRWEIFISGTQTPITGNFTVLVNDLDNSRNDNTFEAIEISTDSVDAFATAATAQTNLIITEQNGILRVMPTDNDPGTPGVLPSNTVQLTFTNTSQFEIFYDRRNEGANFGLDGNFSAGFFDNPIVVDTNADFSGIFTEGQDPIPVAALSADVDDRAENDIVRLNIVARNITDGAAERLTFHGDNMSVVTLPLDGSDNDLHSLTINGTDVVISYDPTLSRIDITAPAGGIIAPSSLDALIRAITYENTSTTPTTGEGTDRTLTFSVTDSGGQTSNDAVSTLTVIGVESPDPIAQDDAFTITEDGGISGSVFVDNGAGIDSDPDLEAFSVTAVNGAEGNVGLTLAGSGGGVFTLQANGEFSFSSNSDFAALDTGEQAITSISYTITNESGGQDSATLSVTLTGDNDVPIIDLNGALPGIDFQDIFVEDQPGRPLANLLTIDAVIDDPEDNIAQVNITTRLPEVNDGRQEILRIDQEDIQLTINLFTGDIEQPNPLVFGDTIFLVSVVTGSEGPDAQDEIEILITNAAGEDMPLDSQDLQGFLRLLAYQNLDQDNSIGDRIFEFEVRDPVGIVIATTTLTVDRANDAPLPTLSDENNGTVSETGTAPSMPSLIVTPQGQREAAALTGDDVRAALANGRTASELGLISVADLLTQLNITDIEQSEFGIGVILADETHGRFQYVRTADGFEDHEFTDFQLDDPDNLDATPIPDGEALLFAPDTFIRFIPAAGFVTEVNFEFRVTDFSVGSPSNPPSTVVDDSGGVAPFNTSSLSSVAFSILIAADTDGDGILNSVDIDDDNDGILDSVELGMAPPTGVVGALDLRDTDLDGLFDHIDIDSDDDGITDTIEAQTTDGFIAPSGTGNPDIGGSFIDVNRDGLDDRFDAGLIAGGVANGIGLTPTDTDGLGNADYRDPDSDDDGLSDILENGLAVSFVAGDTDGDGLADVYEVAIDGNNNDGFRVAEGVTDPLTAQANQNGYLPDDGDAEAGSIIPLSVDLNFRDAVLDNDPPIAQPDTAMVDENTILSANVFADNGAGVDSDPDGDALTVSQVNGVGANVGTEITLASGARLTVNADGTYDYNPAGQFETLRSGETASDSFTYQISDGRGGTDVATVNITITGVSDAPILDLDSDDDTASGVDFEDSYIENDPAINIVDTTGFTLTDVENDISELVITLTDGRIGDTLQFPSLLTGGVTASLTPVATLTGDGTITLTLTGTAATTTADWTAILAAITFLPSTNDVHSPDTSDRHITIQASDENNTLSGLATALIHVIAENDPPTLDLDDDNSSGANAGNFLGQFTEDGGPVDIQSDVLIADLDDINLEFATITLTNPLAGDQLIVDGVLVYDNGVIITPIGVANGLDYTVVLNAGAPEIRLMGTASRADYQDTIALIAFNNTSQNPDVTDRLITAVVNDGDDSSPERSAIIEIIAINDAPTPIDPAMPGTPPLDPNAVIHVQIEQDGTIITPLDLSAFFTDVDNDVADLSITLEAANLPPGLVYDPLTRLITGTPSADASQGGPNTDGEYVILITATDPGNLSTTTTLVYQISNPAPVAANDSLASVENGAVISGNVITDDNNNGADNDPDGDDLMISEVNDDAANIGQPISGSAGGLFTISQDGSYTFVDNGQFEDLAIGQTRQTTVTYQLSDGQGGFDTALVTVTVTGTNDNPIPVDPLNPVGPPNPNDFIPARAGQDGIGFTPFNLMPFFDDPDTGDTLAFSVPFNSLPQGLTLNPLTGVISGTPSANASQGGTDPVAAPGVYIIPVSVDDGNGGTFTTQITLTITNPAPIAEDDNFTTGEDIPLILENVFSANGTTLGLVGDIDPDGDTLVVSGVGLNTGTLDPANVGIDIAGSQGGIFNIGSAGNIQFDPGQDFQNLDDGETAFTSLTYQISDGQGGFDTARVTVMVTGANDAPIVVDPSDPTGPADPNAVIAVQMGADNTALTPIDISPFFDDIDSSDRLEFSFNTSAPTLPAWLAIDPVTGMITGTPPSNASIGGPSGDGVYAVIIEATDGDAVVTTTLNITITNPAPIAQNDSYIADEDTGLNVNITEGLITVNDSDPDGDTLTVTQVNGQALISGQPITLSSGAILTLNSDGSFAYDTNGQFEGLDITETALDSFSYEISDGQGGISQATVMITIEGRNDRPEVIDPLNPTVPVAMPDSVIPDQTGFDSSPLTPLNVTPFFADVDVEPLTFFIDPASDPTGRLEFLSLDPNSGVLTGTPPRDASQGGLNGDGTYSVTIVARDLDGESVSTVVNFVIGNPAPIAQNDSVIAFEDGPPIFGSVFVDNGAGIDRDPDGDVIVISSVNADAALIGQATAGTNGGEFILNMDGSFSFSAQGDFEDLDVTESRDTAVTYQISDGEGGFSDAVFTITVQGANDAPTPVDPLDPTGPTDPNDFIPAQSGQDSAALTPFDVSPFFTDVDIEPLSFDLANAPTWIVIDPVSGIITGTPPSSASQGGPGNDGVYIINIIVRDPDGAEFSTTITFTITNPPPVAEADSFSGDEDSITTFDLFAQNGMDFDMDIDGDVITVSRVVSGNDETELAGLSPGTGLGAAVAGSTGGQFNISADGTAQFDPNGDFEDLAVGESRVTEIVYQIDDGDGGTDTAIVSFRVTGVNDAPELADGPIPAQSGFDNIAITDFDVAAFFADPDTSDNITVIIDPADLPPGLNFDGTVLSGTPSPDASQGGLSGVYDIPVIVQDGQGGEVSTMFTYTVINPAPFAIGDMFTTLEDTSLAVNILANDSDPDGDNIRVIDAVALADGTVIAIGTTTTLAEGQLIVFADGMVNFNPARDFNGALIFGYTISDDQGGIEAATVRIDVLPVNDAPIPVDPEQPEALPFDPRFPVDPDDPHEPPVDPENFIPVQLGQDGQPITPLDLMPFFGDPDPGEVLSLSLDRESLPPGLTFEGTTISGIPTSRASQGGTDGTYTLRVTATDPQGESVMTTLTFIISNPGPLAVDDGVIEVLEDAASIINVLGNDSDPDGDLLTVTQINGQDISEGETVTLPSGSQLTLNADNSLTYLPIPDLNASESFSYQISDADGATSTARVEVSVLPVNDAPELGPDGALPAQRHFDGEDIMPVDISGDIIDPDGDPLIFTAQGLPPGLSLDPETGIITGVLPNNASQGGPYTVSVTATDPSGESFTTDFIWTVDNLNPISFIPPARGDGSPNVVIETQVGGRVDFASQDLFTDPDADILTYTAENLPEGLVINPDTGLISGTPLRAVDGLIIATLRVDDSQGGQAEVRIGFDVEASEPFVRIIKPDEVTDARAGLEPYIWLQDQPIELRNWFDAQSLESRIGTSDSAVYLGGMTAAYIPGYGHECAYIVVEAVAFDHAVNVQLASTLEQFCDVTVKAWDVTGPYGQALPAWVDHPVQGDMLYIQRPLQAETVNLRIKALLDNGRSAITNVEIDLRTGSVTQMGSAVSARQTLDDTLVLESLKFNANSDLVQALDG